MIIENFKNLLIEIEYIQEELKSIEKEIEIYKKHLKGPTGYKADVSCNDMPKGNSGQVPLDNLLDRIMKLQKTKQDKEQLLQIRTRLKEKVENKIEQLDGLDNQVVYLRDIKSMKLQDIADELNISIDWAKKISARNQRVHREYTDILSKM